MLLIFAVLFLLIGFILGKTGCLWWDSRSCSVPSDNEHKNNPLLQMMQHLNARSHILLPFFQCKISLFRFWRYLGSQPVYTQLHAEDCWGMLHSWCTGMLAGGLCGLRRKVQDHFCAFSIPFLCDFSLSWTGWVCIYWWMLTCGFKQAAAVKESGRALYISTEWHQTFENSPKGRSSCSVQTSVLCDYHFSLSKGENPSVKGFHLPVPAPSQQHRPPSRTFACSKPSRSLF